MKHTCKPQMYADIRDAYDKIMSCGGVNKAYLPRKVIINVLMESPAPRFYISAKLAERYVKWYYAGDPGALRNRKLAMIKDLVDVYERKRKQRPYTPVYLLWQEVVDSPAKSFYATPQLLTDIVYFHRNYKDDKRREQD